MSAVNGRLSDTFFLIEMQSSTLNTSLSSAFLMATKSLFLNYCWFGIIIAELLFQQQDIIKKIHKSVTNHAHTVRWDNIKAFWGCYFSMHDSKTACYCLQKSGSSSTTKNTPGTPALKNTVMWSDLWSSVSSMRRCWNRCLCLLSSMFFSSSSL